MIYPDILMQAELREGLVIEIDSNILIKRRNTFQVGSLTDPFYIFMSRNSEEMTKEAV